MPYESVDQLQKLLASEVFHYTKDAKKAAGRALGTLVEIITFYLLKTWGFESSIAIERALAEYGNPDITHNVEYSLHPVLQEHDLFLQSPKLPLSASRLLTSFPLTGFEKTSLKLLSTDEVLRNSCTIAKGNISFLVATLQTRDSKSFYIKIAEQFSRPYAMFECKRVGIEEGTKKGPQTIEKAKQGAYVAKSVSSLHKIRTSEGELHGLIYKPDKSIYMKPYSELVAEIVASDEMDLLRDFILTVGVVSNHGNWFTSDNPNKELKVLAQSYDWLIFLTDEGLAEFITELLLHPPDSLQPIRDAFLSSYTSEKKKNCFTKVQMSYHADRLLQIYFADNLLKVENWFNVIAPADASIDKLKKQVSQLRDKNWREVYSL